MRRSRPKQPSPKQASSDSSPEFYSLVQLLGVMLVAWIVFFPASNGAFVWDDNALPFSNPEAATKPLMFWVGGVRPLLMATYWFNFRFFGTENTFTYHAVNICAHAVAAWLVWICAARIQEIAGIAPARRRVLSGVVAALFLIHPLQTESVDYIAGRSEVLAGLFFFAAFAVFLGSSRFRSRWWWIPSIICLFVAGALSKEHAPVVLGLFVLTDLFWNEGPALARLRGNRNLYLSLLPFVVAGAAFVIRVLMTAKTAGFQVLGLNWWEYFCTQWRVIPEYIRLFVLPFGQSADWMFPRSHSLLAYNGLAYGVALAASVFVAIRYRRLAPLAAYGYLVFLLLLLPTSSIIPIQDVMAERRMYLPIFGLGLSTVALLDLSGLSEGWLKCIAVVVLLFGGALSWERSQVWRSPLALWTDVIEHSPQNLRGRINLASALFKQGLCASATREYEDVKRLQPTLDNVKLDLGLAAAYGCLNDFAKQRTLLRSVAARQPTADLMADLAVLDAKANDLTAASADLSEAIRLNPGMARAWAYRGLLDVSTHTGDADSDFRRALTLDPNNDIARNGLAELHRK
jgi:protein O-mannosyl-transferase